MKLSERAEYELARWAKANPDPENAPLAHAVLKLTRALESSGVDEGDYPDVLRLFARLVEPAPLTPLTVEDGWIEERSYRAPPTRLHNKRWPRLTREADGRHVAYLEFTNGVQSLGVLCEVMLPFDVPDQPIPIASRVDAGDNTMLFPAIVAAGFTPLEVLFET